jgi:hypothetical protein
VSFGLIFRASDRAVRLLCALAVAIVATFHVCDAAAAGRTADVVIAAPSGDEAPSAPAVVEKCHLCAVVSLPALMAADSTVSIVRSIPAGTTLHVAAFEQPAIGPPPRA